MFSYYEKYYAGAYISFSALIICQNSNENEVFERCIVEIEKHAATPPKYPRSYAQIKNNPNLTAEEKRALIASAGRGAKYDTPTVHGDGGSGRKGTMPKYGQLNPDWVEWLMAWPIGWTDLETPNIRLVWLNPSIDPADYGEIPRITNRRDNRPARVKEIGNGQFPLTAAVAFHWGLCVLEIVP